MIVSDCDWYVVHTHPHAEAKAATHLLRQGYFIYLPRYVKRRRHARRDEPTVAPLFPRYLFVAFDRMTQRWRSIESTFGVTHLICSGNDPVTVPSGVVEELKRRENEDGFIRFEPPSRLALGDKICVRDGVFTTCLGLFDGMADRERVAVLLDLLGRKVRIIVDRESVVAA